MRVSLYNLYMTERLLFLIQALVLAVVATVHIAALQLYLYWYFPWLDLFVHFAGGLWVALAATWLVLFARREPRFLILIFAVITVGILWEFFEMAIGMTNEENYFLDTALDLAMDYMGGVAGYFIARQLKAHDTIIAHDTTQSHS